MSSFSPQHLVRPSSLLCCVVCVVGIRELVLCKDQKGKIGLCVMSINKGVFVAMVQKDSPAAMAGLRFGDQILSVSEEEGGRDGTKGRGRGGVGRCVA